MMDACMHAWVNVLEGKGDGRMEGRKEGDGVFSYLSIYLVMRSIF